MQLEESMTNNTGNATRLTAKEVMAEIMCELTLVRGAIPTMMTIAREIGTLAEKNRSLAEDNATLRRYLIRSVRRHRTKESELAEAKKKISDLEAVERRRAPWTWGPNFTRVSKPAERPVAPWYNSSTRLFERPLSTPDSPHGDGS
jgi:hypothetical protein